MAFGFRKSFSLGRRVRLNLSKSGAGVSVGRRGARVSANARGERRGSLSWNGLFWRKKL